MQKRDDHMDRQVERIIRQRNRLMKKCRALKMYGLIVTLLLMIAIAVIVVMAVMGGGGDSDPVKDQSQSAVISENIPAHNGKLSQTQGESQTQPQTETENESQRLARLYEEKLDTLSGKIDVSGLNSPYALLMDVETGRTLAEYQSTVSIYPASLTKIMTAVVAIENTPDLNAAVTVPGDFYEELYAENASMAGFLPDEQTTYMDLLYGILLPSGADSCMTFAHEIAGSEEAFVNLMNQKAVKLGMNNTHFVNATGLHDPQHYTTASDLSKLLLYALENETFREVFESSRHTVAPTNMHPEGFTFQSSMFSAMSSAQVTGGSIVGGKTGYTEEAGLCLASLAYIDGHDYILITTGSPGDHSTEPFHIIDAQNVYNQLGTVLEE